MTNKQLAEIILKNVGENENINSCSHCSTRLRLDLKDSGKVNKSALGKVQEVLSVVEVAGQTQIVLGPKAQYVCDEMLALLPAQGSEKEKANQKKGFWGTAVELISNLFTPIVDVLIGAAMLKGLLSVLTATGFLAATSGTYEILNAAGDSLYYFLPILLAITCSKRFKTNMFVSVTIAGALLYPNITALYNAGTAITFLGIPVKLTAFQSSVFPIVFAIVLLSYVEKAEKKILPDSIRGRIAPFFSLLIVVPITIIIFGPLGSMVSGALANAYMAVYSINPILASGLNAGLIQLLVIFGLHWGFIPVIMSNLEKFGFDTILAAWGPSALAQAGAAFGVSLKTKNKRLKQVASSAALMGFFGISEPALYGVTVKYRKAFVFGSIAGALGGAVTGIFGSRATAMAVMSVPSLPVYFGKGFIGVVIGYFGAFILAAVLVYLFGFDDSMIPAEEWEDETSQRIEESSEEQDVKEMTPIVITAPVGGNAIALSEVKDEVMSSGALGVGAAIIPNSEMIVSPVSGTINVTFSSKHAYGITGIDGEEFLIHIGIDTVKLEGKYFESFVKEGDVVSQGDVIAKVDFEALQNAGYDTSVIVLDMTDVGNRRAILSHTGSIKAMEDFIRVEAV